MAPTKRNTNVVLPGQNCDRSLKINKASKVSKDKHKSKKGNRKQTKLVTNLVQNLLRDESDVSNITFHMSSDNTITNNSVDDSLIIISDDNEESHSVADDFANITCIDTYINTSTPKQKPSENRGSSRCNFFNKIVSPTKKTLNFGDGATSMSTSVIGKETNNNSTLSESSMKSATLKIAKKKLLTKLLVQLVDAKIVKKKSSRQMKIEKPESIQDSYIKSVLKNKTNDPNGSNLYNPFPNKCTFRGPRIIIIDGSNVAMGRTQGAFFSVEGLKTCIDYFLQRGHEVKAFVPRFRGKYGKSSNPSMLRLLEKTRLVVYTPSREIYGQCIASYDDRYIVQCAAMFEGVIVSNDNYADIAPENSSWRYTIQHRVLPFTWFNDTIIFPEDPLGRYGPKLKDFLQHPKNYSSCAR